MPTIRLFAAVASFCLTSNVRLDRRRRDVRHTAPLTASAGSPRTLLKLEWAV